MTKIKRNRKVRFYTPGAFAAEQWTVPFEGNGPYDVEWPEEAYSFQLIEEVIVITDDGIECRGVHNITGKTYYHPNSTIKQLKDVSDADTILRSNMQSNGWDSVVFSRWGNWPQPFHPGQDVILSNIADRESAVEWAKPDPLHNAERVGDKPTSRKLVNGCTLYREHNAANGYTYYSDEVGGGVEVWDTALVDTSTLLAAIAWETNSNVIDLLKNTDDALSRTGMETKLAQEYIRRALIALTGMTPGDDV